MSNHMPRKVWGEITYPSPNLNGTTVKVLGMDKQFDPTFYNGYNYLAILGVKLINVTEMGNRMHTL